jgi:Fe-S-cluster containining protein
MLTAVGRCAVYGIRPMVCRLWGLVEGMPCPHGCRPDGGLLPDTEGRRLLIEAERIGGTDPSQLQRLAEELFA